MERVKYCGHVLHGGMRSPPPSKVDAVRNWPKPKTPKQMKGFFGGCKLVFNLHKKFFQYCSPVDDVAAR